MDLQLCAPSHTTKEVAQTNMYSAYQYNGSAVGATLCLCHRAPGTGPVADPDSPGHPTASSQVDPFFNQDDPYETTEGPTGRFRPTFKDGLHDAIRIESRSIRRTGPRTGSIYHNWIPMLSEKVVVLALGPGVAAVPSGQ